MKVLRGLFAALISIIWHRREMGVFPYKIFSQKAWSMVAISARVAPR